MEKRNFSHMLRKKGLVYLVVALSLAVALVVVAFLVKPTGASADQTTLNSISTTVIDDGSNQSIPEDSSTTDGVVSRGNSVGLDWTVNVNGSGQVTLSSSLPEGVTWDETSFALAGLINHTGTGNYTSSPTVSPDKRTLTVVVNFLDGTLPSTTIVFHNLRYKVDPTTPIGTKIAPTVIAGSDGVLVGEQNELTVAGLLKYNLDKDADISSPAQIYDLTKLTKKDFGDGNGEVPAVPLSYKLVLSYLDESQLGVNPEERFDAPLTLQDTITIQQPDGTPVSTPLLYQIISSTPLGAILDTAPKKTDDKGSAQATFKMPTVSKNRDSARISYQVWIPASVLPDENIESGAHWSITNQADGADIKLSGQTATNNDPSNGNTTADFAATSKEPGGGGGGGHSTSWKVGNWDTCLSSGSGCSGHNYHKSNGDKLTVGKHALIYLNANVRPAYRYSNGNRINKNFAADFTFTWDSSIMQVDQTYTPRLVSGGYSSKTDFTAVGYRSYVTTTDINNRGGIGGADAPKWVDWNSYSGDWADVKGVRIYSESYYPSSNAETLVSGMVRVRQIQDSYSGSEKATVPTRPVMINVASHSWGAGVREGTSFYNLYCRDVQGKITTTGINTDTNTDQGLSGQPVKYVVKNMSLSEPWYPTEPVTKQVTPYIRVCIPSIIHAVDYSSAESKYTVRSVSSSDPTRVCGAATAEYIFQVKTPLNRNATLPQFEIRGITSTLRPDSVPASDETWPLTLEAQLHVRGGNYIAQPWTATSESTITVAQASTKGFTKYAVDENVEQGSDIQYRIDSFNFTNIPEEVGMTLLDVLPYDGDGSTQVHGSLSLKSLNLLPSSSAKLEFEVTTSSEVRSASPNWNSVTWVPYTNLSQSQLNQVTAVRTTGDVSINEEASLTVTLTAPETKEGDTIVNQAFEVPGGDLSKPDEWRKSDLAQVKVIAAAISGRVVEDSNKNDTADSSETVPTGAKVSVFKADSEGKPTGDALQTTKVADSSGEYSFKELDTGDYVLLLDLSGLTKAEGWAPLFAPQGAKKTLTSGLIHIVAGQVVSGCDFGIVKKIDQVSITKTAKNGNEIDRANKTLTYDVTITNSGETTLTNLSVQDLKDNVIQGEVSWPGASGILEPGQQATMTCSYLVTQADFDSGSVSNQVLVHGDGVWVKVQKEADTRLNFKLEPGLQVTKTVIPAGGKTASDLRPDDILQYEIVARNTGNVTLTDVSISDSLPGLSTLTLQWPDSKEEGQLAPGQEVKAKGELKLTEDHFRAGSVDNTATVTGNPPKGDPVSESGKATIKLSWAPPVPSLPRAGGSGQIGFFLAAGALLLTWLALKRRNEGSIRG